MKLFLQLEISNWRDSSFHKPLLTFASSLSSDLIGAEMDNQSEIGVTDVVTKLIDQTHLVFILIKAHPEEETGSTLKVINHLLKTPEKVFRVIVSGTNSKLEKLIRPFGQKAQFENDEEKIKSLIEGFASA